LSLYARNLINGSTGSPKNPVPGEQYIKNLNKSKNKYTRYGIICSTRARGSMIITVAIFTTYSIFYALLKTIYFNLNFFNQTEVERLYL